MKQIFENIKVWLLVKLVWRRPSARARSLLIFSATEADSAWQLHQVIPWVADAHTRHELFEQILEEMNHSELFASQYRAVSSARYVPVQRERQALYTDPQDAWKFFAYCIVGEKAALDRFSAIAKALPDSPIRDTFRRILRDEAGHVHSATELANELGIDPNILEREIKLVKRRRFREAWMRQGRQITDVIATLFLSTLYYLVAPFGYLAARRKIFGKPVSKQPVNSGRQLAGEST